MGIIAQAGRDAETGVVMLRYLELAYAKQRGAMLTLGNRRAAIYPVR